MRLQAVWGEGETWLGLALMACSQNGQALEQFQKALDGNPNFVGAMINAGLACEMMGAADDAAAFYRRTLEIDPDNIEARERLEKL